MDLKDLQIIVKGVAPVLREQIAKQLAPLEVQILQLAARVGELEGAKVEKAQTQIEKKRGRPRQNTQVSDVPGIM
jgi:hypothetical protein